MSTFSSEWLPCKRFQAFITLLIIGISVLSSQIPDKLIKELDEFNAQIHKALVILNSLPEDKAISELAKMKKDLNEKAGSLSRKMNELPEPTEQQEEAFMEQQMGKKLYKDMMSLLSDPEFNEKILGSSSLSEEYEYLMVLMDLEGETEAESGEGGLPASVVCSFNVSSDIPNSGLYQVSGDEDNAMGFSDDAGGITIEIFGYAGENEIMISILADEAKPGKYVWTGEGQIYIQSQDEDGNEVIQLQNYHEEGSITLETVGPAGGRIIGSFQGLFFDDMEQTDEPVSVEGQFNVLHFESPY
jgi:hypothetical protein